MQNATRELFLSFTDTTGHDKVYQIGKLKMLGFSNQMRLFRGRESLILLVNRLIDRFQSDTWSTRCTGRGWVYPVALFETGLLFCTIAFA